MVLFIARGVGLFAIARHMTARQLRILCYHGVSIGDEQAFAPDLFMRLETLRRRFALLKQKGYRVISLEQASRVLHAGKLPPHSVVITFDDGFFGNVSAFERLYREFRWPTTLYVTTYYVDKGTPIFRHAVRYLAWRAMRGNIGADALLSGVPAIDVNRGADTHGALDELIRRGETELTESERVDLCHKLGVHLGVDYAELSASRRLSLASYDELKALAAFEVDIQLHTHRHRMPDDLGLVRKEISDNAEALGHVRPERLEHFCYPSGLFSPPHAVVLNEMKIRTATTCEPGLNDGDTPPLALRRFLDVERLSDLEFESEVSGFREMLRRSGNWIMHRKPVAERRAPVSYE